MATKLRSKGLFSFGGVVGRLYLSFLNLDALTVNNAWGLAGDRAETVDVTDAAVGAGKALAPGRATGPAASAASSLL